MPKIARGYTPLTGSERQARKGASRVGPADPQEVSMVSVYLREPEGVPALPTQDDYMSTPPSQRRQLTRAEHASLYAAAPEDVEAVKKFADDVGLAVTLVEPERRLLQLTGTNKRLAKAFGVELSIYQSETEGYRGHEGPIHIPKALAGVVEGVFGLDNRRMARRSGTGGAGSGTVTPPGVAQAYNFPTPAGGASGETVAILEFSGPTTAPVNASTSGFSQSDIDGFINNLNATTGSHLVSTNVKTVAVDKSAAAPGNVPAGSASNYNAEGDPDEEVALDIEVVVSVAQQANVVVYFAPITEQGWVDAVTKIVADTANDPSVLSISWGWSELETDLLLNADPQAPFPFAWSQQAYNKMTKTFQSAAAIGMTVLASTGDHGSDCLERDGNAHVQYPASDPWVIACGGTIVNTISPLSEGTWNEGNGGGATGGGISYLTAPVPWQANAKVPKSANADQHEGRGLPDVAGNAAPESGYTLWLYGKPITSLVYTAPPAAVGESPTGPIGGTSAVGPLYASLIALINASLQTRVGYINPILYELGTSSVFRDINDGVSNSVSWVNEDGSVGGPSLGYSSSQGWDACTGWGTIDGSALLDEFQTIYKKQISFYIEHTTFSQDEVELQLPGTAKFVAGWIAMDNFLPSELGLTAGNLDNPPSASLPTITFTAEQSLPASVSSAITTMIGQPTAAGPVLAGDAAVASQPQRFLFPFTVEFAGDAGFLAMTGASPALTSAVGTLSVSLTVPVGKFSNATQIQLTTGEDPRFEDINPGHPLEYQTWESFDLRVFKMTVPPGATVSRFGANISGPSDAPAFIAKAMANLTKGTTGTDTFESIPQEESQSKLEFQQKDDSGNFVYNFALARVRLKAKKAATAKTVRVFFRLFQAQNTVSNFEADTTYRYYTDGTPFGHEIPLLGVGEDQNGAPDYVTIPCFASDRITLDPSKGMAEQYDAPNAKNLATDPGGEAEYYFGCWIDNNQQYGIIPASPPSGNPPPPGQASQPFDGPWPGVQLEPMLTAFTAFPHQCVVAEIRYEDTPIQPGWTTINSDKLAQRNIAWLDAPNPGVAASRRVAHPVQVRPTPPGNAYPDELMITWGNTPVGTAAELYFPALSAADVVGLAEREELGSTLYEVDANTVGFATGEVTFVPLPPGTAPAAGLLSIELPPGVHKGDVYTVDVRQFTSRSLSVETPPPPPPPPPLQVASVAVEATAVSDTARWSQIDGSFRFVITIGTKAQLLPGEERLLAVLRWLELHTSTKNRWYPVITRYLGDISGRVSGFGGDPTRIAPSPIGQVPGWPTHLPPRRPGSPVHPHPGSGLPGRDDHCEEIIGKIERLIYDHFGDFVGFTLELESGDRRYFFSREPAVRDLTYRAWINRTRVSVLAEEHRHEIPRLIELLV
jgi:hypothetical protein